MSFLLGVIIGSVFTIGAAFIIAPDDEVDKSNN